MAQGINKAILVGNLGADPEVRYTQTGTCVTNISVATSETWNDKTSGQAQEKTEWHRVVLFARLGEVVGEYLKKGAKVYVEGRIQTRKWQGQDGQDRYSTEIVAHQMQMLDSRAAGANSGGQAKAEQQASAARAQSAADYGAASRGHAPARLAQPVGAGGPYDGVDDLDDDIPF